MASEYVKQVLNAESLADKAVSDAKIKCSGIIADAERYSDELMKQKIHDAEVSCIDMKNKNSNQCEIFSKNLSIANSEQKKQLIRQADEHSAFAEKAVAELILNL